MVEPSLEIFLLLLVAAFAGGFIDAIAGGGALITVPALMLAGFTPVEAVATNKLQALFGVGTAAVSYAARGHVDLRRQLPHAAVAAFAGATGAYLATIVPGDVLRMLLPFVLIAIAIYFALKPNVDDLDRARRISPLVFGATVVPVIGTYDGMFGPGAGSFLMLAFVSLAGYGVLKATAHTKLLNFSSNVGSFSVFVVAGVVAWKVGLAMGLVQLVAARLGAALAMRKGAPLIKPLLILICVALALRLLADPQNPLRQLIGY